MIALAIIGGLLVTLIYTLNYHLGIAERHEFVTVGSLLARDKVAEVEKTAMAAKGQFPAPYSDYRYDAQVRDSQLPGVAEISVVVTRENEHVTFTELVEKKAQ